MSLDETQKFINEVEDIIGAIGDGLEGYLKKQPSHQGSATALLCAAMLNTSISMEQFKKAGGTNEDIKALARIATKIHVMYRLHDNPPQVEGAVA